jgi:capsular polysaccharide biosynthesis protein
MEEGYNFQDSKFYPLIESLVSKELLGSFKYLRLKQPGETVFAPLIFLPQQHFHHAPRQFVRRLRGAVKELPVWQRARRARLGDIVVHDRVSEYVSTRVLAQGADIRAALQRRYGLSRKVVNYLGNESLADTLTIFSSSTLFVTVHGAGETNMIMLADNATVVEIMPHDYIQKLYAYMSTHLGFHHFIYVATTGSKHHNVTLNLEHFLPYLFGKIDWQ